MSVATLVLGPSGSGKSTSLRNLDPAQTLLIQAIKKPLPFRAKGWSLRNKENPSGNIFQTDDPGAIEKLMRGTSKPIIVIDDFGQVMTNRLMADIDIPGYAKFTALAKEAWNIFIAAGDLAPEKRVYIMAHTETSESGEITMKTVGRMVAEKLLPAAYFTVVLRAMRVNEQYVLSTQTNGFDQCKSPIGLFAEQHIPNDLAVIDQLICEYWSLPTPQPRA